MNRAKLAFGGVPEMSYAIEESTWLGSIVSWPVQVANTNLLTEVWVKVYDEMRGYTR